MIRVGILGAESDIAGELLRLLVHHPEVELEFAFSPSLSGRKLTEHHRGLIGDTELRFTNQANFEDVDLIFITSVNYTVDNNIDIPENLKVITISGLVPHDGKNNFEFIPAVSEMYRKPLVRGAKAAEVVSSALTVSLIALFPLALHLMLNDSLSLSVELSEYKLDNFSIDNFKKELQSQLKKVQLSFNEVKHIEIRKSDTIRALKIEIELESGVNIEEIKRIYSEVYDDHNFTFLIDSSPSLSEVAGTHKCLIYVSDQPEGKIRITAVADSMMRGGAGDAVHAMNLLFGLFEKIGLSLPAGLAFNDDFIIKTPSNN